MSATQPAIPNAGILDRRITLQRFATAQDPTGDVIETWVDLAEVWAAVEPLGGLERLQAAQLTASIDTRFTIRYRPDLTAALHRIRYDGKLYDIVAVIELGRREGLQLDAAWADAPTSGMQRARVLFGGAA